MNESSPSRWRAGLAFDDPESRNAVGKMMKTLAFLAGCAFSSEDVVSWLGRQGGEARGVEVGYFSEATGGRGLRCSREIAKDDPVLTVPLSVVMSSDVAKKELGDVARDAGLIALFLVKEKAKGNASRWAPYISTLPLSLTTLKSMSDDELKWLQDDKLAAKGKREAQKLREEAENLEPILFRLNATILDYVWARSIVDSRALTFKGTRYLAPVADFVNYAPVPALRESDAGNFFLKYHKLDDTNLQVFADRSCDEGDQFLEDYGDNPNTVYLEYHGFVPSENPFDCISLTDYLAPRINDDLGDSSSSEQSEGFALRVAHLQALGERGPPSFCVRRFVDSRSLRRYLWAVSANRTELTRCLDNTEMCPGIDPPVPVGGVLCDAVKGTLAAYPTTFDEDSLLLEDPTFLAAQSPGVLLAVKYRRAQKRLLKEMAADFCGAQDEDETCAQNTTSDEELTSRIAAFNGWARNQSWSVLRIEAARLPSHGGRLGAVATEAVAKGQTYIEIPETACLNVANAKRDLGADIVAHLDDFHALLVFLLTHVFRQNVSPWAPYLRLLPGIDAVLTKLKRRDAASSGSDDGPPLLWADDEAEMAKKAATRLKGSALEKAVVTYGRSVVEKRRRFAAVVGSTRELVEFFGSDVDLYLDWHVYRWATHIIDSRSIWWHGHRHLVPMLDLVNAAATDELPPNAPVHRTDLEHGNAVTRAATSFAVGEQVLEDYGQPNHVLFLYHGFVLPVNKHDCLRIDLTIDDKADLLLEKLQSFRFSDIYTTCLRPKTGFLNNPRSPALRRLFTFVAMKYDVDPPSPTSGPSLELLLLFADELYARLEQYEELSGRPTNAEMLLTAEHQLLLDLHAEVTDKSRDHEAFIGLRTGL